MDTEPLRARTAWPSVTAVIPTRNRPRQVAEAVDSVLSQVYAGDLTVIVVADRGDDDPPVPDFIDARVIVTPNVRSQGLGGARNTGTLASSADLVAFCDDDDVWLPGKLSAQISALLAVPTAQFATCAVEVSYEDHLSVRLASKTCVTHEDLVPSRMSMLHSSTFVAWRTALIEDIGLVEEHIPGSHNEDWDLLLRASARSPIVNVDEPLVRVAWSASSFFSRDWARKIESLEWMLERHPEIDRSSVGASRVYGQIAFAHAASGQRRSALRWAARSMRKRWREPRGYLAVATAAGLSDELILRLLHRRGRGV
jgi:glycosyltransferase involved in cell wall biosynthesis